MPSESKSIFVNQVIPISLTVVIFGALVGILYVVLFGLNSLTVTDVVLHIRAVDVLIGLIVYLKTSIDFAIYIGRLMDRFTGWKSRIAIEIGTAVGNACGTLTVLIVWSFFKEVRWLLALMILVAALVLFRLAEDSLDHAKTEDSAYPAWFQKFVHLFEKGLSRWNAFFEPLLRYLIPRPKTNEKKDVSLWGLFLMAFTVPFILGLDDFAGYIPLFNVVNVFGFGTGVFLGHMILSMLLYISPTRTIKVVKNTIISLLGSIAFILLGAWGVVEVVRLLFFLS